MCTCIDAVSDKAISSTHPLFVHVPVCSAGYPPTLSLGRHCSVPWLCAAPRHSLAAVVVTAPWCCLRRTCACFDCHWETVIEQTTSILLQSCAAWCVNVLCVIAWYDRSSPPPPPVHTPLDPALTSQKPKTSPVTSCIASWTIYHRTHHTTWFLQCANSKASMCGRDGIPMDTPF